MTPDVANEFLKPYIDQCSRFVHKGWGYEFWAVNKPEYCGKELFVYKGKKCSAHYHKEKDETFFLFSGRVKFKILLPNMWQDEDEARQRFLDDDVIEYEMYSGETLHLPPRMIHQFIGMEDSRILEFSTEHKDEDSYRIIYGD